MEKKIKLGLIGVGHMGQYHVNVARGLKEYYDVVGVYDASADRASEISKKFEVEAFDDYEKLISQSDALTIAVPTSFHYEIAKSALNQGKHVLVEKPMTETVEQAREIVELAEKKGVILQVGHVERFNGAVLELGKVVENPLMVESRRMAPFNPRISDVGVVLDLMIHDLDIIINLIGEEITTVQGRGLKVLSNHEDVATAILQFKNGVVATITASRVSQSKIRTLTLSQEKAYIYLDFGTQDVDIYRQASSAYLMTPEELKYKQESFVEKIYVHKDNPLRLEHIHFIETILGKQSPIVSGHSDIQTLEVAHRILEQVTENMKS